MRHGESAAAHPPRPKSGQAGGVILAGGHSRRMGCDKAGLLLGDETFLQRICRVLSGHFQPLVVVCRQEQQAGFLRQLSGPETLPTPVVLVDQYPERGPLEGLTTALEFLAQQAIPLAVVTTCDAPLIQPRLLKWFLNELETASQSAAGLQAVMPFAGQHLHGLTAAYRTEVCATLRQLLEQGERRIIDLPRHLRAKVVSWDECREADPAGLSLSNANTPEEYRALCQRAATES